MKTYVYSLQKTLFEGKSDSVTLPSKDGEICILPGHEPLITNLKKGKVSISAGGKNDKFEIQGGVAYIDGKTIIVLSK
jgi:F-type H+-transporting ATPase subunit epsilon